LILHHFLREGGPGENAVFQFWVHLKEKFRHEVFGLDHLAWNWGKGFMGVGRRREVNGTESTFRTGDERHF
jgi:hypothetical protein